MTTAKTSGIGERSPPKKKQSSAKKARRKTSTDDGEVSGSGPAHEVADAAYGEFTKAFDLTDISNELQQKMVRVAPVLLGRRAEYTRAFFCDVVGLCGEGVPLNKVQVTEREIQEKWPIKNSRYEIVDCLDSDEAAKFTDHWAKVSGGYPDNAYFTGRFVKGCYATFVHSINVNWTEEALDVRRKREEKVAQNPFKLGPVALRQQIEALCKLIVEIEASPGRGVNTLATAKDELQQYQEDEVKAKNLKCELIQRLNVAKEGLEKCFSDSESDDLNARYSRTDTEAKSLRRKGNLKGASAKRAEAETLLAAINEMSEKTKKFEDAIIDIEEELLPKATAEFKSAQELVAKAKDRVRELTTCPGCKDAMARLEDSADADPTRTPNLAPNADPTSLVNAVADLDLASPTLPVADALPASPTNSATKTMPVADAHPASLTNCATKIVPAADALPASSLNCATKTVPAADEIAESFLICATKTVPAADATAESSLNCATTTVPAADALPATMMVVPEFLCHCPENT